MGRDRGAGRPVPGPGAPLRARLGPVWAGIAVRTPVDGADAHRRGYAGAVAAGPGRPGDGARPAGGRRRAAPARGFARGPGGAGGRVPDGRGPGIAGRLGRGAGVTRARPVARRGVGAHCAGRDGGRGNHRLRVEPHGSRPDIGGGLHCAARRFPGGTGGQRNVPLSRAPADRGRGEGSGRGRRRAETALGSAGAPGTREFPLAAAGRARRLARYRGRAAFQAHRPAQPADGAAGLPRPRVGPAGGTVCNVDHAPGLRRGGVAAALRAGGPPMAHRHRRDGSAVLAGEPCL